MIQEQEPDHDALLESILTGERSVDDPLVAKALEQCGELAETLQDLQNIQAQLDIAGESEHTDLSEFLPASREPASELDEQVSSLARERLGTPRARYSSRLWAIGVAAALVLTASLVWMISGNGQDSRDLRNGILPGGTLGRELPPVHELEGGTSFSWNAAISNPGGSFHAKVYQKIDGREKLWLQSQLGIRSPWKPTEVDAVKGATYDSLPWSGIIVVKIFESGGNGHRTMQRATGEFSH